MKINKISFREIIAFTHDGVFHSDEVFAVALLRMFHKKIKVIRTRNRQLLQTALDTPDFFVLDVGREFNPGKRNFDHHQQDAPKGLSTVWLLFEYLFPDYEKDPAMKRVHARLITVINEWDQGKNTRFDANNSLFLPVLIYGFNRYGKPEQDYQFLKAVDFAYNILGNELNTAKEWVKAEEIWKNKKILNHNTVLLNEYCSFWRSIQGNAPRFKYIMQPENENWSVLSVDSAKYPLPEITNPDKNVVFQHKDRFITVFKDYETAINYVNKNFSSINN